MKKKTEVPYLYWKGRIMLSKNHSYFFVPFRVNCIDDWKGQIENKVYSNEKRDIKNIPVWRKITDDLPVHLMKFITNGVGYQTERHDAYQLVEKRAYGLPYTDGKRKLLTCAICYKDKTREYTIDIRNIKIHCFGTNIGFLVYDVWYSADMGYQDILEFNYMFKKVGTANLKIKGTDIPDGRDKNTFLYRLSQSLIANNREDVAIFFHSNHFVRMQSNVFTIFCDTDGEKETLIEDKLFHLCHSYTTDYGCGQKYPKDSFCCFHPYTYIHWGGCQEGIACIYYSVNDFTSNDISGKLQNDYYFMYLILLNQRYTLLSLVDEMMTCEKAVSEEWRRIQHKLIIYQMEYSFRIVSDELTYHRIYSDMRNVLAINELEDGIKDISDRMYTLKNEEQREKDEIETANRSWRMDLGLGMLSLLAVFSAFVDSTDILDRLWSGNGVGCLPWQYVISYIIAYGFIICVMAVVVRVLVRSYIQYRRRGKEKNQKRGE